MRESLQEVGTHEDVSPPCGNPQHPTVLGCMDRHFFRALRGLFCLLNLKESYAGGVHLCNARALELEHFLPDHQIGQLLEKIRDRTEGALDACSSDTLGADAA